MSDTDCSKIRKKTGLPERTKHGYLHFQINDYTRWPHESYHGPGAVRVLRKHLVINDGFSPLPYFFKCPRSDEGKA